MKAKLIPIGNSKGIRIPIAVLRQFDFDDEVNMEVEKGRIILQPAKRNPREGWTDAFRLMHLRGEDRLLIDDALALEMRDWEWK